MAENCEAVKNLTSHVDKLIISNEKARNGSAEPNSVQNTQNRFEKWGFPLQDLYKMGLKFYKEQEGKAVNLTYQNKLRLVSYTQQISHGPYSLEKSPPLGVLDVIGRNRRDAWQSLGNMSKEDAMINFIDLLNKSCSLFKPFVDAQKADYEEKQRFEEEKRRQEMLLELKRQEEIKKAEEEKKAAEEKRRHIQDALNMHTFQPFKAYAEDQYPGNPEQAVLVRQLQEQHYYQYMQYLLRQEAQGMPAGYTETETVTETGTCTDPIVAIQPPANLNEEENAETGEESDDGTPRISPPSMWTRKDIKDFKESIRKEGADAIIRVGHGEIVTVRVPTHNDGNCLFWEFATDNYDIGFGVYFEWTKPESNQVSVHIQDSEEEEDELDDEDDMDDEDYSEYIGKADIERGRTLSKFEPKDKPLLSPIVPIYRRDCQEEVYAGSHVYPGQGVYLLKFDNSYSLWRSKTLYYRVFYTK